MQTFSGALFMSFFIVAIGISIVLGLIIGFRINAFVALIAAALAVSFLCVGAAGDKVPRVADAFGTAAGKIGLVIGFAAVIGEAMMRSGAADRIVQAFLKLLGVNRAPWALMGSGFVLSVPVFFDTVFYLLVPLARSLYARTGKNFLLYVLAISAGGAITHTLVPPTPGPLIMASTLGVSVGLMIFVGSIVALPAAIAGIFFAKFLDGRVEIESLRKPEGEADSAVAKADDGKPAFGSDISLLEALLPVILPVLLISGDTVVDTLRAKGDTVNVHWVEEDTVYVTHQDINSDPMPLPRGLFGKDVKIGQSQTFTVQFEKDDKGKKTGIKTAEKFVQNQYNEWKKITVVAGNAALALGLSMALSVITWVRFRKPEGSDFSNALETALLSGGLVILITAAGGAFGAMLKLTGISDDIQAMSDGANAVGMLSLFLAFGLAALLKVAQGSSTTAMIVVSGMMASMGLTAEQLGFNMVYICTAIGAGSCIGSWMNDSGFWIVAKMSGLSETEALKTWTPLLALLGIVSLTMTIILTKVMPMVSVI
jgi:GntP family gluconate:H+ symporter